MTSISSSAPPVQIAVGVKSDPIEYRYSFEWLLDLMAEEGARLLQLGSFFELYQLDDSFFADLRAAAESRGITIASVFTAHRELGGFFIDDPRWHRVARKNYERLIDVAALVGASHCGSNPGAAWRDAPDTKRKGIRVYLDHMKELMHYAHARGLQSTPVRPEPVEGRKYDAHARGVQCLLIEPMSCLAEPPTLPDEIAAMAAELSAYHSAHADTAAVGYCADTSHGYADAEGRVVYDHVSLFRQTLPWLREFHVKNTGHRYESTFGFSPADRERGIVDLRIFRRLIEDNRAVLPTLILSAYLEISGPKLGRDYSDPRLDAMLRESLRHVQSVFVDAPQEK